MDSIPGYFCSQERFVYYVQKSVEQGAFLPVEELLERFLKCIGRPLGVRQRKRYRIYLQGRAEIFSLKFEYISFKHGKKLYVMSSKSNHYNEEHKKHDGILYSLIKCLRESEEAALSVYAILSKLGNISRSTQERVVKALKLRAKELGVSIFKEGRNLCIKLMKRVSSFSGQNTRQRGDISYYREAKDSLNRNTPNGGARFKSIRMRRKAFFLMRELKKQFYDNVKVKICEPMLYRFAEWSLCQGFNAEHVKNVFNYALLERHKDATDMGLNLGRPTFKFEMSSTVSLGKERLQGDGLTVAERWEKLRSSLSTRKKEEKAVSMVDQIKKPEAVVSKGAVEEENQTDGPIIEEELFLVKEGYRQSQIAVFRRFQEKKLLGIEARVWGRMIVRMGCDLAQAFPDSREYKGFRG